MVKKMFMCVIGMLAAVTCFSQPVWGRNELKISCEGVICSGGGTTVTYQYTLICSSAVPETLTEFYLGTDDLNVGNYTNWMAPPGFTAQVVVADWDSLRKLDPSISACDTDTLQTPHGVTPQPPVASLPTAHRHA